MTVTPLNLVEAEYTCVGFLVAAGGNLYRQCLSTEFSCDKCKCLASNLKCNGNRDCNDGSDEMGCSVGAYILNFLSVSVSYKFSHEPRWLKDCDKSASMRRGSLVVKTPAYRFAVNRFDSRLEHGRNLLGQFPSRGNVFMFVQPNNAFAIATESISSTSSDWGF